MTFPRVYLKGLPKTFGNVDQQATQQRKNRPIITEKELMQTLKNADQIENPYFRLRAKAIIALAKIFGKRRIEITLLEIADIKAEGNYLFLTFTIAKKHKRGFFQYLEYLKKMGDPELLNKSLPELQSEWAEWTLTEQGYNLKKTKKPKATPLSDKYAKMIFDYYQYVKTNYPESRFLFPSGKDVFGRYVINPNKPLTGRHILNIISPLNPDLWLHLFRKTKGSEVARKYGRSLESVFMVKDTLDLERQDTAFRYIEEFVPKIETGET